MSTDAAEFAEALGDGYSLPALKRMLEFGLGKDLEDISIASSKKDVVADLIRTAKREDWFADLVHVAHEHNPDNARIAQFHKKHIATHQGAGTEPGDGGFVSSGVAPKLRRVVGDWWELIVAAAILLVGLFVTLMGSAAVRSTGLISGLLMIPVIALGYWLASRRTARRAQRHRVHQEWEADKRRRTAFRGLYPFEEDDHLPGVARVREAGGVATRVASDDFRFGIVCGDSGCGKTSMLRTEVERILTSNGLHVVYVRTPRRLVGPEGLKPEPLEKLQCVFKALSSRLPTRGKGVLILDQFEDLLIEVPSAAARHELGAFLGTLTSATPPIRVLCAVPSRYFAEIVHDIAPALPEPIAARNLFLVKNLELDEAEEIILQCAEIDGLYVTRELARTIASDLQEDGFVRPPELQIVCKYLGSNLSLDRYRLAGGAAGILSHHIRDALSLCRDPATAARVLRALCDFPAGARGKPKAIAELEAQAGGPGPAPIATIDHRALVKEILLQLEVDRLVIRESRRGAEPVFALIHDYLVDSVRLATSDVSTKAEEANQWLHYYLSPSGGTIPLSRVWLIRRHADPKVVAEPKARRLILHSLAAPVLRYLGTGALATLVGALVYLLATAGLQWNREVIGRHRDPGDTGTVTGMASLDGRFLTGASYGDRSLCAWDGRSGKLLMRSRRGPWIALGPGQKFAVTDGDPGVPEEAGRLVSINTADGSRSPLPFAPSNPDQVHFGTAGTEIEVMSLAKAQRRGGKPYTVDVYSLMTGKIVGTIPNVTDPSSDQPVLVGSDRLLVNGRYRDEADFILFDVPTGDVLRVLKAGKATPARLGAQVHRGSFDVDEALSRVATLAGADDEGTVVTLWSLRTGECIRKRVFKKGDLPFESNRGVLIVEFAANTAWLVIRMGGYRGTNRVEMVLDRNSLAPVRALPGFESAPELVLKNGSDGNPPLLVWVASDGILNVWHVGPDPPTTISGVTFSEDRSILPAFAWTGSRLLILNRSRSVELWDLVSRRSLGTLSASGVVLDFGLSLDGHASWVLAEGGLLSVFDSHSSDMVAKLYVGGEFFGISFDPACRRILIWQKNGEVVRYTEGRNLFNHFYSTGRCPDS
jgi:hypothetical protein